MTSLLPQLDSILATCTALNLAYLALPRLRYRSRIAQSVRDLMSANSISADDENLKDRKWVKAAARLARLDNHKGKFFQRSPASGFKGTWVTLYEWIYMCQIDRYITTIFAFLSVLLMFYSVHHSINSNHYLSPYFASDSIEFWIKFIGFMCLTPAALTFAGNYVVKKACDEAKEEIEELANQRRNEIDSIAPPTQRTRLPVIDRLASFD